MLADELLNDGPVDYSHLKSGIWFTFLSKKEKRSKIWELLLAKERFWIEWFPHPAEKAGTAITRLSSPNPPLRRESFGNSSWKTFSFGFRSLNGQGRSGELIRLMPNDKNIHVVPHGEQWAWRREGSERVSGTAPTQAEAVDRAREVSRREGGELLTHRPNGQIRDRDSHGNDPRASRG
jgi:hypothetical protein